MTPEKTPEQWMAEAEKLPWTVTDFHAMALLAAQTIPNQTVGELLASADKIEAWLRKPDVDAQKHSAELRSRLFGDYPRFNEVHKKSPVKIDEASDGVGGD